MIYYNHKITKEIFQNEKDALVEYINQNAKRLPKGLSCLIKVVNTFSHDSFEDKELLNSIYTNIDNVSVTVSVSGHQNVGGLIGRTMDRAN